jgi:hypothetical protein
MAMVSPMRVRLFRAVGSQPDRGVDGVVGFGRLADAYSAAVAAGTLPISSVLRNCVL